MTTESLKNHIDLKIIVFFKFVFKNSTYIHKIFLIYIKYKHITISVSQLVELNMWKKLKKKYLKYEDFWNTTLTFQIANDGV